MGSKNLLCLHHKVMRQFPRIRAVYERSAGSRDRRTSSISEPKACDRHSELASSLLCLGIAFSRHQQQTRASIFQVEVKFFLCNRQLAVARLQRHA